MFAQRHRRLSKVVGTARDVAREQSAERVGLAASGAAFWLVISAFPTAIAVVSVYGLFVSPQRVATDLGSLANGVPGSLGALLTQQLQRVAATDQTGLSLGLVLSVVLAVWSASAGVNHLDSAIREAYGLAPQRYVQARGRAVAGAMAVVVLLGFCAIVLPAAVARLSPVVTLLGIPVALIAITAPAASFREAVLPRHYRAAGPCFVPSATG